MRASDAAGGFKADPATLASVIISGSSSTPRAIGLLLASTPFTLRHRSTIANTSPPATHRRHRLHVSTGWLCYPRHAAGDNAPTASTLPNDAV
eukprot:COSAG02_NODE_4309_length_5526_cov_7.101161_6_plen_92_part_01